MAISRNTLNVVMILLVLMAIIVLILSPSALNAVISVVVTIVRVIVGLSIGLFAAVYLLVGEAIKLIPAGVVEEAASSIRAFSETYRISVLPTTAHDLMNAMQWALTWFVIGKIFTAGIVYVVNNNR